MLVQNYAQLKSSNGNREQIKTIIEADAERLGGHLNAMTTRSVVYHHIYVCSGGNFIFPLLAAHGALWARWYLFLARFAALFLAVIDISRGFRFKRNLNAYKNYVETFKAINRTVMTKTWVIFHMTKLFGVDDPVTDDMPPRLRGNLALCHQYATTGTPMPLSQQREFYEDYFRWEQVNIVGPTVDKATGEFDWPIMKWFCLRPWVWFSYFQLGRALVFKNFSDAEERTQKGLAAFDWAIKSGRQWEDIEANLTRNPFFPRNFSFDPNQYFTGLKGLEESVK